MSEWIISVIERTGYLGIALLMMLENVFPPIPSELVLPFAGYVAASGKLQPVGVLVAAVTGSLLGALPWYWLGRKLGHGGLQRFAQRHGRLLTLEPQDIDRAQAWFKRHGPMSVAFGRLVPAVRSVISMPAGVGRMPVASFLLWSLVGTTAWSALLMGVGYMLQSRYEEAKDLVEWITRGVLVVLVGGYLWRVWRFGKADRKREQEAA
ncbi:DedA family protein [Ramlibacter sp. Leaf400]|uniref:DedA family protein n=1 Tax=Ramlibacter sp. Leaf400 TaxID=1736365 RepID=UPI00070191DA|nr:DedA family protein [Ramlibacter sp. Leaf400]KQT13053.1 alkaline phosphatase [Ramlibacter sp. Leaf400]